MCYWLVWSRVSYLSNIFFGNKSAVSKQKFKDFDSMEKLKEYVNKQGIKDYLIFYGDMVIAL